MKRVWNILIFTFFVFSLFLVKPREDVVFAAINKSQCIRLFEKGKDFELYVEESMRYTGIYTISKDTVFLRYQNRLNQSGHKQITSPQNTGSVLPLKLLINKGASRITASDGISFSAQIYLDMRNKSAKSARNRIRFLNKQKAAISAMGSN